RADGAASFSDGSIGEMTSQYMLFQVYPEWMTFENYHLTAFMKATHLAFLHEDNRYHSCYPLEYWSEKHGVEFIGKMWREVHRGEDPVMAYKRLTGITQEEFNDEMFDAARHFVTWDMPRIEKVAARYANQHTTSLTKAHEETGTRSRPPTAPRTMATTPSSSKSLQQKPKSPSISKASSERKVSTTFSLKKPAGATASSPPGKTAPASMAELFPNPQA